MLLLDFQVATEPDYLNSPTKGQILKKQNQTRGMIQHMVIRKINRCRAKSFTELKVRLFKGCTTTVGEGERKKADVVQRLKSLYCEHV